MEFYKFDCADEMLRKSIGGFGHDGYLICQYLFQGVIASMQLYDFRNSPKCPFGDLRWNKYYWEYPREIPDYEEEYWSKTVDPDGKIRDMLSEVERKKQIEDLKFIINKIHQRLPGKIIDVVCGQGNI